MSMNFQVSPHLDHLIQILKFHRPHRIRVVPLTPWHILPQLTKPPPAATRHNGIIGAVQGETGVWIELLASSAQQRGFKI